MGRSGEARIHEQDRAKWFAVRVQARQQRRPLVAALRAVTAGAWRQPRELGQRQRVDALMEYRVGIDEREGIRRRIAGRHRQDAGYEADPVIVRAEPERQDREIPGPSNGSFVTKRSDPSRALAFSPATKPT